MNEPLISLEIDMNAPGLSRILKQGATLERMATGMKFGEGPVWNSREDAFYWVDIVGNTIWKKRGSERAQVVVRPSGKANGLTFDRQGRLLAAGWAGRNIWRLEPDGSRTVLCSEYKGRRINSPNDLVVKSDGAIYFTDPSGALNNVDMGGDDVQRYLDFHGVYRVVEGHEPELLADDFVYPNGLAFSVDESLLYINDTRQNLIRVGKVQPDGRIGKATLFARLQGTEPGRADGLKVDTAGNVYCTGPGGVHVFSPDGSQLGRIKVPGHPTNIAFGDRDWRALYIVTQTCVFRTRLALAGLPVALSGSV